MSSRTNDRKLEHVRIVQEDAQVDRRRYYFDEVRLKHRALPELSLEEIDTSVEFLGKRLSFPLLISSMTGGDHELLRKINRNLAIAAEATGVAMAVGSQRVMFINPEAEDSFALRPVAPNALLFSNLGAVQLNYGFTVADCRRAVEVVGADGLYLHLNPLQEAIQPEGDTNFTGLVDKIGEVVSGLEVPVILKEVGSGFSEEDVRLAIQVGVRYIDVAGAGGTSWSRIEHHRQVEEHSRDLGLLFQDWGIPTPTALRLLQPYLEEVTLIASGGIRSGVDMVKAIILGASLCGVASPFLAPATESADAVIALVERFRREFRTAMFVLGAPDVAYLKGNQALLLEEG